MSNDYIIAGLRSIDKEWVKTPVSISLNTFHDSSGKLVFPHIEGKMVATLMDVTDMSKFAPR